MAVWLNVPKSSGLIDGTGSELCAGAIPSHRMHLKKFHSNQIKSSIPSSSSSLGLPQ